MVLLTNCCCWFVCAILSQSHGEKKAKLENLWCVIVIADNDADNDIVSYKFFKKKFNTKKESSNK